MIYPNKLESYSQQSQIELTLKEKIHGIFHHIFVVKYIVNLINSIHNPSENSALDL
jgi:hypothetical protein